MIAPQQAAADGVGSKRLGPGWRCDACEYPLEGLPDRADETRCPECGQVGRPVGAPAVPRTAEMALAAIISGLCIVLAGLAGLGAYAASQADTSAPEQRRYGLIGLGVALAILYMGIAVWGVPLRRWRIARFIGALIPAALGLTAAWTLLSYGGFFSLGVLTLSVLALSYLVHPEIDRWLRRRRPPSVQR